MWTDETIFSEGDLNNVDEYLEIVSNYVDGLQGRYEHVLNMLTRLQAEKALLEYLKKHNI